MLDGLKNSGIIMSLPLKMSKLVITGMGFSNVSDLHCRYTSLNIKLHGS